MKFIGETKLGKAQVEIYYGHSKSTFGKNENTP